jgi:SlyX protein
MTDETDGALLAARLDTLETKIAYQDQVIEELNKAVVEQWNTLDALRSRVEGLQERIRDIQDRAAPDQRDEPPPPHY